MKIQEPLYKYKRIEKKKDNSIYYFLFGIFLLISIGLYFTYFDNNYNQNIQESNKITKELKSKGNLLTDYHDNYTRTIYFIQNNKYYKALNNETSSLKIEISKDDYEKAINN